MTSICRAKHFVKIISINVGLALFSIGLFVSAPIVLSQSYEFLTRIAPVFDVGITPVVMDQLSSGQKLPNYQGVHWADQHFEDLGNTKLVNVAYLGWKNGALESPTINITDSGLRQTVLPNTLDDEISLSTETEYWMFGGSTVFGWGVNDANTIPSILASVVSNPVVNFGTPSYRAFQGVVRLIGEYGSLAISPSPTRAIIFLDGGNDVLVMCRKRGIGDLQRGIGAEGRIDSDQEDMAPGEVFSEQPHELPVIDKSVALSPRWVLQPALSLIERFKDSGVVNSFENDLDEMYLCDNNHDRARFVAAQLVSDWLSAKAIAENHGDRFVAFLQPIASLSRTRIEYLPKSNHEDELVEQYSVVYPLIRQFAREADLEFHDLSGSLNRDEHLYIDLFHLSHQGTRAVAQEIAMTLSTAPG